MHHFGGEGEMSYEVVRQAIVDRASLTANYEDYVRYFSPHAIGKLANGVPVVVAFQYDGGRKGGLPVSGAWCLFLLPRLHYVRRVSDRWMPGLAEGKPTDALAYIDIAA